MKFGGIQKTSLIDFPDRIATVLFTPGCNLRCPYCHNWRLVMNSTDPFLSEKDALQILEDRKHFIDSVVITGGEPTIHPDLPEFIKTLKENDYKVKLDTNGLLPEILEKCSPHLDYIAVDVKTSPELYPKLGTTNIDGLQKTIELLKRNTINYELRCTTVPDFVNEETLPRMGEMVKDARLFSFQQFIPGDTLNPSYNTKKPYTEKHITHLANIMKSYVKEVIIRV